MLAVVDTNVLVSGLLHADSLPAAVLRDIARGRLTPVVSIEVLDEYRRVLPRPRLKLDPSDIEELLGLLAASSEWVRVPPYDVAPALPDPADWPFIACALAAGCPVITGNARHFPGALGVQVMTARQWAQAG
jgi:putative PIN family toxin of toxin-antitoxin system